MNLKLEITPSTITVSHEKVDHDGDDPDEIQARAVELIIDAVMFVSEMKDTEN